jgi:hypothetical protein
MARRVRQYWVVGATWGSDDLFDTFMDRGYWEIGYSDKQKPDYAAVRAQMQEGDRIAIKTMLGQGSSNIRIRAIGIIKEVDDDEGRVYVDWLLKTVNREVPSKGCYGTIHGPYRVKDDLDWLGQVFRI